MICQEECDVYRKMWDNVSLVDDGNGAYRVKIIYLYQHNPHVVFAPENSN